LETKVTATDAEGKPTAQNSSQGPRTNRRKEWAGCRRIPAETVAADSVARKTLKVERQPLRGPREESGRFGAITGRHRAGFCDEDAVRLRILADAHTFKAGDEVAVHWRGPPWPAHVQGGVLDYKLIELKKGPMG
jgi:hypothetical protein